MLTENGTKTFFSYKENMKIKVEVKIPCLRKAACQFSRMQICSVSSLLRTKTKQTKSTSETKNNYSNAHHI